MHDLKNHAQKWPPKNMHDLKNHAQN